PLEDVARQDLRIAGTDGVDEVLVVRELRRRQARRLFVRGRGSGRSRPFLVPRAKRSHVRLPVAPALLDREPALRAEEQVADAGAALIGRVLAARAELENHAIGVLEHRRLHVGRFLRSGLLSEVAAHRADLDGMFLLAEPPPRDVELVRTLVAGIAVAI